MAKKKKTVKAVASKKRDRSDENLEARNASDRRALTADAVIEGVLLNPDTMQEAVERMESMRDAYREQCLRIKPNGEMPQHLIQIAHLCSTALDTLSGIRKEFNEHALSLRRKGRFAPGPCVVTFERQAGRRSPAWKDEAIARAREAATLKGKGFTEKKYVERVMERTEPSPDTYKTFIEVRD